MRLQIHHVTHYALSQAARRAVQYLRLTPRPDANQRVIRWAVTGPPSLVPWRDGLGNRCHVATEAGDHTDLAITVEGEVETSDTHGVLPLDDGLPPAMFRRPGDRTQPDDAIRDLVRPLAERMGEAGPIATLHAWMNAVADALPYTPGATTVHAGAAEALAAGQGVCQDHAHLFIAGCHCLGLPARYVSGYLGGGQGDAATHAWAEAYIADLGWISFDPANRQCATDAYVRLAIGFDYGDAAPVTGVRTGGGGEDLAVQVQVQRLE